MTKRSLYSLAVAAVAMAAFAFTTSASADLYWSSASGGTNWSDSKWATSPGGTYDQPWTAGENAVFEGTPGTVTVSGNIDLSGLTFNVNADNYNISGGTLDFRAGSTILRTGGSNREHKITSAITGAPTVDQDFNGDKTYWMIGTQNIGMYRGLEFLPTSGSVALGTVNNPRTGAGGDKSGLFLGGTTTGNTVDQILRPGGNYGSVGKDGSGEWTVDGDIQTGFLAIKEGKLAINGTVTATYIQFSLAADGILAPGASIGTVAFNQYWRNVEDNATIEWEFLNDGTAGTTYDQIVLNGGAYWDLAGLTDINIDVVGLTGHSVGMGDTFQLIAGDVRNFDANIFNFTGTNAGSWEISDSGGLLLTSTIPEPGSLTLLLLGLLGLIGFTRRKRFVI